MSEAEERVAGWLLDAETVEDVELTLLGSIPFDVDGLLAELARRAETSAARALPAHAELAEHLAELVEEYRERILNGRPPEPEEPDLLPPDLFFELMRNAQSDGGLLAKFVALRRVFAGYEVSVEGVREWLRIFPATVNPGYLATAVVVAFLAGEEEDRTHARIMWAVSRKEAGDDAAFERQLRRLTAVLAAEEQSGQLRSALERIADSLLQLGDRQGAVDVLQRAAEVGVWLREENVSVLRVTYRLASELRGLGRIEEARRVLSRLDVFGLHPSRLGMFSDMLTVYSLFARIHLLNGLLLEDLGDYDLGRLNYQNARQLAVNGHDDALEFAALANAAGSHLKAGRLREAVREFRQAHTWTRQHPQFEPAALNNLGQVLSSLGDHRGADSCYRRVIELFEQHGSKGSSKAIAWFGRGDAARDLGDRQAAMAAYWKGLEAAEEAQWWRGGVISLIGRVEVAEGGERYRELVADAVAEARRSGEWVLLFHSSIAAAALSSHDGDLAGAVTTLRDLRDEAVARDVGPAHLGRVTSELARTLLEGPDGADDAFALLWQLRDEPEAVDTDLLLDLLTGDHPPARLPDHRTAVELAFDLHEAAKADSLLHSLAGTPLPAPDAVPEELLREEKALLEERRVLASQPSASGNRAHRSAVDKALSAVWERMRPHSPEYASLRAARPSTFAQLRESLAGQGNTAVVSLYCAHAWTLVFSYSAATDRLALRRLSLGRQELADVAQQLRRTFNGDPDAFPPLAPLPGRRPGKRDLGFFHDLADELLAFLPDVEGAELLRVAPHGPVHALPLHALPVGNGVVAQRHFVSYTPTVTALLYTGARRSPHPTASAAFCAGAAAREDADPAGFEQDGRLLAAAGWQVEELTGLAATRDAVLSALRNRPVAHLTCHGHVNKAMPLDSGLLLSDGERLPGREHALLSIQDRLRHVLTAADLARAQVSVDLLTLRACSTGVHDLVDNVGSLAHALLYAGVNTVVAALWNVDQASSRALLVDFYRRRLTAPGEPVWRSLWEAQRAMIENPRHEWEAHPYHWAPFVLIGEG